MQREVAAGQATDVRPNAKKGSATARNVDVDAAVGLDREAVEVSGDPSRRDSGVPGEGGGPGAGDTRRVQARVAIAKRIVIDSDEPTPAQN